VIHTPGYLLFAARRWPVLAPLLVLALLLGAGARAQDVLPPDQAFGLEARMVSPDALEVTWRVAEGHYMYRRQFSVTALDEGVVLGEPVFPPGKNKNDEFFGDMEVYESDVTFTVPVSALSGAADALTIEATGQGCNEPIGICYPPVTKRMTVPVIGMSSAPAGQSSVSAEAGFLDTLLARDSGPKEFLPPDQVFRLATTVLDDRTVMLRFVIEPGYYLYKDKIDIRSVTEGVAVSAARLPEGEPKNDEYFGESRVFYDTVEARLDLQREAGSASTVGLQVGYQGCAEGGICYPPIEKTISVALAADAGVSPAGSSPAGGADRGLAGASFQSGWAWPLLLAFGAGLLLTFTPCVLPMVPILGGVIVGQGSTVTRLRGGALAGVYVLGTAVTYTGVGILAGLTGDQLQAYFQNIWAMGFIVLLLTVMALAMFGLFELAMPSAVQTRLQRIATGLKSGAFGGVFLLGMLSALIVGACVSPVLISVLGLAISRGDPWLGGAIMFAMALGMGVFLVAMGLGFGHVLPRAGPWMNTVKHVFGIMLLAVAVYLLGAIPGIPVLYLWAGLLVGVALYLGARGAAGEAIGFKLARQLLALLLAAWAALAVVGGLQGGRDILNPIDTGALLGGGTQSAAHVRFQRVSSLDSLAARMRDARARGMPVMVDYYADWCVDCVRMEQTTFSDPEVARVLNNGFVLLQVDVTDANDPGPRAIKQSHGVFGPPAMLFFNEKGEEVADMRRYGYMDSEALLRHIEPLR